MKSIISVVFLFISSFAQSQIKDSQWFNKSILWNYKCNSVYIKSLNTYTNEWDIKKNNITTTPITISNNYVSIYGESITKYEILDVPLITIGSTSPTDEVKYAYQWPKVWDSRGQTNCLISLVKYKSGEFWLMLSYKKPGTNTIALVTIFVIEEY